MSQIIKKVYYRLSFTLVSPLNIGSGYNKETDKDILRDSRGIPYIPGSSIAGVSRDAVRELSAEDEKTYFGYVSNSGKAEKAASRIVFFDAFPTSGSLNITVRDSVALDECKTAKKGAKFDMEVLEPGVEFVTFIEQDFYAEDDLKIAERIVEEWLGGNITLGAKTTRGYGEIARVTVFKKSFDLNDAVETKKWLDFNMYEDWKEYEKVSRTATISTSICLSLKQVGGISVRRYTTEICKGEEGRRKMAVPDSEQLTVRINGKDIPTIPGSTWAGAFRHRMREFLDDSEINQLFGTVEGGKTKSIIRFSETQILGATSKVLTRNAIDRFSGGAADSALFTEKTYFGGNLELKIAFSNFKKVSENAKNALAATIADLGYGFLTIGGLTAIGRGLFKIERINGETISENDIFARVKDIMKEVKA